MDNASDALSQYRQQLAGRYPTMRRALDLLGERGGKVIIETGCVRMENDWGAGMSTLIFARWCYEHSGFMFSVDNSIEHLRTARRVIGDWLAQYVTFIHSDSVAFLNRVGDQSIDLLYLDSLDYPYGEMLDLHGGRVDIQKAASELWAMTDEEVLAMHGDLILPSQAHCRNELLAAMHALKPTSIVLIDDANFPGGGKPRLAKQVLRESGWLELSSHGDQQTLWVRQ